jgi:hypothetical protein
MPTKLSVVAASAVGVAIALATFVANGQTLQQLPYNNPDLVVDLGAGLWAWPIPCDADCDGDFDLIVSCPDKPSNGVWLFENPSQDPGERFPVFKAARKLSATAHYVMPSYVETPDGKRELRVLTPGFEHPNFATTGLEQKIALPIAADFYKPLVPDQPKGPKVSHRRST